MRINKLFHLIFLSSLFAISTSQAAIIAEGATKLYNWATGSSPASSSSSSPESSSSSSPSHSSSSSNSSTPQNVSVSLPSSSSSSAPIDSSSTPHSSEVEEQKIPKKINPLILHEIIENDGLKIDEKLEQIKTHCTSENINTPNDKGDTPLHILCQDEKNMPIIQYLIRQGAYINAQNNIKETPLILTLTYDEPKVASFLIAAGAHITLFTLENAAATDCHIEVLKELLTKLPITATSFEKLLQTANKRNTSNNPTQKTIDYLTENKEKIIQKEEPDQSKTSEKSESNIALSLSQKEEFEEFAQYLSPSPTQKKIITIENALEKLQELDQQLSPDPSLKGEAIVNKIKKQKQLTKDITKYIKTIQKQLSTDLNFQNPDQNGETFYTRLFKTKYKTQTIRNARAALLKTIQEQSPQNLIELVKQLHHKRKTAQGILRQKEDLIRRIKELYQIRLDIINSQDIQGNTALHWVSYLTDDEEILAFLLSLGANPAIKNNAGSTAQNIKEEKTAAKAEQEKIRQKALAILKLPANATEQEIKTKIKKLRKEYNQDHPVNQTSKIKEKYDQVINAERILINNGENVAKKTAQITDEEHEAHELKKAEQLKNLENISSKEEIESSSKHASLADIDLDESPKKEDKDEEKELKKTSGSTESGLSESESSSHIPLAKTFAPVIAQSTPQAQTLKKPATVTSKEVQALAKEEKKEELNRIAEQERKAREDEERREQELKRQKEDELKRKAEEVSKTNEAKAKEKETTPEKPIANKLGARFLSQLNKKLTPGGTPSAKKSEKSDSSDSETPSSASSSDSAAKPTTEKEEKKQTTIQFDIEDLKKTDRITQARKRASRTSQSKTPKNTKTPVENLTQSSIIGNVPNPRLSDLSISNNAMLQDCRKNRIKGKKTHGLTTIETEDDDFKTPAEQAKKLTEQLIELQNRAAELASEPQEKKEGIETLERELTKLKEEIAKLPVEVQPEKDGLLSTLNSEIVSNINTAKSSYQQIQTEKQVKIDVKPQTKKEPKTKAPITTSPKKKVSLADAFKAKQAKESQDQQKTDKVEIKAEEIQKKEEDELTKQTANQSKQEDVIESEKPEQKEQPEELQKGDQKNEEVLVDQENPEDKKEEEEEQLTEENTPQNNTFKIGVLSVVGATAILGIGYKVKQCYDLYQALKAKELENSTGARDQDLILIAAKECLLPEQVIQWLEQKQRIEPDQEQKIESKEE